MTTAMIQPQSDGSAVFELNGMTHEFPNWEAAVAEARHRGITPQLLPFPSLHFPPAVEVLAVAPALRVLT